MESNGGEKSVMKVGGKGFTEFFHMMSHYLNTRRWLGDTFV